MNTQTHLLLACAILIPAVSQVSAIQEEDYGSSTSEQVLHTSALTVRFITATVVLGALIPDASLFVMWCVAKLQGVAESVIWQDWYYSAFWQKAGAITNSIPVFLFMTIVGWLLSNRGAFGRLGHTMLVFSLAALLHVFCDLPLHHDDGHPHFWPFSQWIYSSPVSYWDPAHYGHVWSIFEMCLAVVLLLYLWRRFKKLIARSLLLMAGFSYAAMISYWWLVF